MKAFNLSKKSLHWHLAVTYGNHCEWDTDPDLCSYLQRVVQGVIVASLAAFVGGLGIGVPFGELLAWIAYVAANELVPMTVPAAAAMLIIFAVVVFVCGFLLFNTDRGEEIVGVIKKNIRVSIPKPKQESFIVLAYHSFKDKTCVRLSIQ
jgi:hypothetical protein